MSNRPFSKAKRVLKTLQKIGWVVVRSKSSQRTLKRDGKTYEFSFHDKEEIGPKMLARIAKHTGLSPDDL